MTQAVKVSLPTSQRAYVTRYFADDGTEIVWLVLRHEAQETIIELRREDALRLNLALRDFFQR